MRTTLSEPQRKSSSVALRRKQNTWTLVLLIFLGSFTSILAQSNNTIMPVLADPDDVTVPHVVHEQGYITLKAVIRNADCNSGYDVSWDVNGNGNYDDDYTRFVGRNASFDTEIGRTFVVPNVSGSGPMNINVRVRNRCANQEQFATFRLYVEDWIPSNDPRNWTDAQIDVMAEMAIQENLWNVYRNLGGFSGSGDQVQAYYSYSPATYLALDLFLSNGHMPAFSRNTGNGSSSFLTENWDRYERDPYAHASLRLLNYLNNRIQLVGIAGGEEDNTNGFDAVGNELLKNRVPGTNDNGGATVNLAFADFGFIGGNGMNLSAYAKLLSYFKDVNITLGQFNGQSYEYAIQQFVDYITYAQIDGGCAKGGFYFNPINGSYACQYPHLPAICGAIRGLKDADIRSAGTDVVVNNRAKYRIADNMVHQQRGDGLAGWRANSGAGMLHQSPVYLGYSQWVGIDQFSHNDGTDIFSQYGDFTAGRYRQAFDTYISAINQNFTSVNRSGSIGWRDDFWENGDYLQGNTNGIYLNACKTYVYGAYEVATSLVGWGSTPIQIGNHDYKRMFLTGLMRGQDRHADSNNPLNNYNITGQIRDQFTGKHSVTLAYANPPLATVMGGIALTNLNGKVNYGSLTPPPCNEPQFTVCPGTVTAYTSNNCTALVNFLTTASGDGVTGTYELSGATTGSGAGDGNGLVYNLGTTNVRIFATNSCGVDTCDVMVTVLDTVSPSVSAQNVTVQLDASGNATILSTIPATTVFYENWNNVTNGLYSAPSTINQFTINSGSVDLGNYNSSSPGNEIDLAGNSNAVVTSNTISLTPGDYTLSFDHLLNSNPQGNNSVQVEIDGYVDQTYASTSTAQSESVSFTITSSTDIAIKFTQLGPDDAAGSFIGNIKLEKDARPGFLVENSSSDACGIASISVSDTNFTCADVGNNTVTLTVTDVHGNSRNVNATVTVEDATDPAALAQNITVYLDANGTANITAADVDNGSSDVCGIASLDVSPNSFSCSDIGANSVTLTVTDPGGNNSTANAVVNVQDTTKPSMSAQNTSVQLDANGNGSILLTDILLSSADNCGISSEAASQLNFNCNEVGANTVTITVTDVNGNISQQVVTVTVLDVLPINAGNDSFDLTSCGTPITFTEADLLGNDSDPYGQNLKVDFVGQPGSGSIADNGNGTFTYTPGQNINHTATASYIVKRDDGTVVFADNGHFYEFVSDPGITWTQAKADAEARTYNGQQGYLVTITSASENQFAFSKLQGQGWIGASDNQNEEDWRWVTGPEAGTLFYDQTTQQAVNGAYANWQGGEPNDYGSGEDYAHFRSNGQWNDFPNYNNEITGYVVEYGGSAGDCNIQSSATGTITFNLNDVSLPNAVAKDITIQLDANGNASIVAADVDNGSSDDCGIANMSVSPGSFDCSDIDAQQPAQYAIQVDGQNDYIDMGNFGGALANNSQATAQIWMNPSTINSGGIQSFFESNDGYNYFSIESAGNGILDFYVTQSAIRTNSAVLSVGQWINITAVYDGTLTNTADRLKLYINGNLVTNTTSFVGTPPSNMGPVPDFYLGSQFGTEQHAHVVYDEVRVWDRALSTAEVAGNWDKTIVGNEAGLIAYYSFEDGPGSSTVTELTGIQGSAQLTNMDPNTAWVTGALGLSSGGTGVPVTLTVTDVNGNNATASANVTVEDNIAPTMVSNNLTVVLADRNPYILTQTEIDQLGALSSDNCAVDFSISSHSFSCADVGQSITLTLTGTDPSGNTNTTPVTVTVTDPNSVCNDPPVAVCQNITVYTNANCEATIAAADIDNGSSDPDVDNLTYSLDSYGPFGVGTYTVTLTVDDGEYQDQCTAMVTVIDNVDPVASAHDITVQLDANGNASIVASDVDNGSSDACGIASLSVSPSTFDCSDVGANTVTLTVTDNNGNVSTTTAIVTVEDNVAPVVITQNITVHLDASGNAGIIASDVENGSSDACGIATLDVQPSTFNCNNVGTNTVTLTVTDVNGNSFSASAIVTVEDNIDPVAIAQDITVQLDANGTATITAADIDNGSSDACGIQLSTLDVTTFDCSNVGPNTVVLTVTDVNGNNSSANSVVTVEDNVNPVAMAQDITVQLDASGYASILTNGSTTTVFSETWSSANPGLYSSGTVSQFTINSGSIDVGDWIAGLPGTEIDLAGNSNAVITSSAITLTPGDYTFSMRHFLNNNPQGGNSVKVEIGSFVDQTYASTSSVQTETVSFTVTTTTTAHIKLTQLGTNDAAGSFVDDIILVKALPGSFSIENNSTDACGIASISVSDTTFDCSDVGANTVTLTVTDVNGNSSNAIAIVTVEDNVDPVAIAKDITVQLDISGNASITAGDVDNGSSDACGIATLDVQPSIFNCTNVGSNTVTLTVADNNGNVSTGTAVVSVEDNVDPVAIAQDITVQLDASGNASIVAADVDNGSSDACGIASLSVSPSTFDCSNVGANTATLTVTDNNGNTSIATATITVEDNVAPVVTCLVDITAYNKPGFCSADVPLNYLNASDACGTTGTVFTATGASFSPPIFNNVIGTFSVGTTLVTATVTDVNGNSTSCQFNVTVMDTVGPEVFTNDITVQLDVSGNAGITTAQIDNSTYDDCALDTVYLDAYNFGCGDVGANILTLTAIDIYGNISTTAATVTVEDNIAPVAMAQDFTVQLDASGNASIAAADIDNGSSDACGIATLNVAPSTFNCTNVGANTVTLTVTDNNGNISIATSTVTVQDNIAPVAFTQDITVQLDATGNASIVAADVDNGSSDACGIATLNVQPSTFDCTNVGANTVTLTVIDNNGNTSTALAVVTVEDNVAPVVITEDITVQLDASGNASIVAADVDNGSDDACGIATLNVQPSTFNCSNVGANTVMLTVVDVNGNISSSTATVTVEDNVAPIAIVQNITVTLDKNDQASITAIQIDNGSNDACGIASLSVSPSIFGCNELGANEVTLTVVDNNGNVSTATADVTVEVGHFLEISQQDDIQAECKMSHGGAYVSWNEPTLRGFSSCSADTCNLQEDIPGFAYLGKHNGHRYYRSYYDRYTWSQANAAAQMAGGHLVVINDAQENHFITCRLNDTRAWIGLNDDQTEGNFGWVNGDVLSYTNWKHNEPNNNGGRKCYWGQDADYVVIKRWSGEWEDRRECDKYEFIMEIPCGNNVEFQQIAGPPSGSLFASQSTTTITYVATDTVTGATDTMSFDVVVDECVPEYCTARGYNTCYEWIEEVSVDNMTNTSGDDNGYGDYTNLTINATHGQILNLSLTPGHKNKAYKEYWTVYVDWNRDGDFCDWGECVYYGKSKYTINTSITVPQWAAVGDLRMRVMMKWGGYAYSCSNFAYGEVEDYTITIGQAAQSKRLASNTMPDGVAALPSSNTLNFELVELYPNPVSSGDELTVYMRSTEQKAVDIHITDAGGKVLWMSRREVVSGENTIVLQPQGLSRGVYFLSIDNRDTTLRFVVQ